MNQGWIKLHRSLLGHDLWLSEPFTRGQAWVDLLMLANHQDGFIRVKGRRVPIKRGQVGYSQTTLAQRWQWSRKKVSNFLKELRNEEQQIELDTSSATTIVTIRNYDRYQQTDLLQEPQKSSGRTTEELQKNTNKNEKNDNKNHLALNIPFLDFWNAYGKQWGNKSNAEKLWSELTDTERTKAMEHIPSYKEETPGIKYRQNPERYLKEKTWENTSLREVRSSSRRPRLILDEW